MARRARLQVADTIVLRSCRVQYKTFQACTLGQGDQLGLSYVLARRGWEQDRGGSFGMSWTLRYLICKLPYAGVALEACRRELQLQCSVAHCAMASLVHRLSKHPACSPQSLRTCQRRLASLAAHPAPPADAHPVPAQAHSSRGRLPPPEAYGPLLAAALLAHPQPTLKSSPDNGPPPLPNPEHEISDQEWETRTGAPARRGLAPV